MKAAASATDGVSAAPAKKAPPAAGAPAPSTTAPAAAPAAPAAAPRPRPVAEPEPIDLLEVAGGAALTRYAVPAGGVAALLFLIIFLIRRRTH